LRDERFKAAVSIAGPMAMFTKAFFKESETPFLMVGSTVDAFIPYDTNAMVVPERVPRSVLVSISSGTHTGFADFADPFLSFLSNPDSLGCSHIEGKIPKEGDMLERLGGATVGIDINAKDYPCQLKELPKGLNPARQHQLTKMAVLSFFESLFSKDSVRRDAMKKYLSSAIAEENTDASVRLSEGY
jgi:predicted dienelactone hydrolase